MRSDLLTGTVTFLFTDVEGSTKLLRELGAEVYAKALAVHRRVVREACAAEGGVEVDTQGDAFFFAFPTAPGAVAAARVITERLEIGPIRLRMGLHTGAPLVTEEGYVGDDVHFAARVGASGHGGQVLLSQTTRDLLDSEVLLSDLGEHRLKDIDGAVVIFQLGSEAFPPLKTTSNTNLPRPASSFVGRGAELAEVLARIERGARLMTLTGPGGSGKTRLALEAAASLVSEYRAGVFWVGLAALRDPALVTETMSQTLGAKEGLAEHIGERETLLLLDNLEQVVEAAPELASLLESCPNLVLLVTSRELLRVRGEVEYPVPPLASPEAVALFCERTGLEPSGEIAELCVRLDNLPLAVELAAARTKALSPTQILERITQRLDLLKGGRDADPRQQTLRATIEWSYDLLNEEEQRLFARLSVFAGGFTLEAADEVCEADLDTLQSLVEKSLLRFTNGRYWMLETIREYAAERLNDSGEYEDLANRHAHWLLSLARDLYSRPEGPSSLEAYDRLEPEQENLRTALARAEDANPELLVEIPGLLWRFWVARASVTEARKWLETGLSLQRGEPTSARERLLAGALWMAYETGDYDTARERAEERLEVAWRLGDMLSVARSLSMLASMLSEVGDFERAMPLHKEAVATSERCSEASSALSAALHNLGAAWERAGDGRQAREAFERALAIDRAAGDLDAIAVIHHSWAAAALLECDYADARRHVREALQLWLDHRVAAQFLDNAFVILAELAYVDGRLKRAARHLATAERFEEESGRVLPPHHRKRFDNVRALLESKLPAGALPSLMIEAPRVSLREAVENALTT
jgi:predicted ATPase/class 3 adenylate cyclase